MKTVEQMKAEVAELVTRAVNCKDPRQIQAALGVFDGKQMERAEVPQGFMTGKEITGFCRLSRTQIWKMRRSGMPFIKVGSKCLFQPSTVEKWLIENCRTLPPGRIGAQ